MLWIRGLVFTVLVPGLVGLFLPSLIYRGHDAKGGLWGTPAIFFTRRLRVLIGEEPRRLVQSWLYRFTRNPMYVGVLLAVFGQLSVQTITQLPTYPLTQFARYI